jgi:hypothetical protein
MERRERVGDQPDERKSCENATRRAVMAALAKDPHTTSDRVVLDHTTSDRAVLHELAPGCFC